MPDQFWVYQEDKGRLFSLKPFSEKSEAIKYADTMFKRAETRGVKAVFVVHLGHELLYSAGAQLALRVEIPT